MFIPFTMTRPKKRKADDKDVTPDSLTLRKSPARRPVQKAAQQPFKPSFLILSSSASVKYPHCNRSLRILVKEYNYANRIIATRVIFYAQKWVESSAGVQYKSLHKQVAKSFLCGFLILKLSYLGEQKIPLEPPPIPPLVIFPMS